MKISLELKPEGHCSSHKNYEVTSFEFSKAFYSVGPQKALTVWHSFEDFHEQIRGSPHFFVLVKVFCFTCSFAERDHFCLKIVFVFSFPFVHF